MIFALDSNIILYAEGVNDDERRETSNRLIDAVGIPNLLIPLQVFGETVRVLTKRATLKKQDAVALLAPWFSNLKTQDTTRSVFEDAMALVTLHHFQVWDAIILAATKAGGASVLFSEDMQDGFIWENVIVINPFAENPHPLVVELLSNSIQ